MIGASIAAAAPEAEDRLAEVRSKIERAESRETVLSTDIERIGSEITELEASVAALREREATLEAELAAREAELADARRELAGGHARLREARARLRRALVVLRERLVAIYKSGGADAITILLSSRGYGELVERSEYLERIREQDEGVTRRVRDLRDNAQALVRRLRAAKSSAEEARNAIAARERQLATARAAVEAEQGALVSARARREQALAGVGNRQARLEEIEAELQAEIEDEVAAATAGAPPLPAGPSASNPGGLIWPVQGIVTSGYGYRWGRIHEGLDISVPEGTPILAAAGGTVILAAYTGGYGNYTCVDHGGGLSTCYAHQSGFAAAAGESVEQGETIGYSGNTGNSTGPHLHFEVRVNGASTDPFGYL